MKTKRFVFGMLLILAFGILVVGCTSTSPVMYTNNTSRDFIVLGEVTYKAHSGGHQGLIDFLNEAKKQYPETEYIVDIMIDSQVTKSLFGTTHSYTYRGTAIKYK